MGYHKFLILICFLLISHGAFAQTREVQFPKTAEQLDAHFNQNFYATGEDIWYKIYILNKDLNTIQSRVARIEWLAPNGKVIHRQALEITGNYALGDFSIPYDWVEGVYTFRAYTTWSLNYGEAAIFNKEIPIFQVSAADTAQVTLTVDTLSSINKTGDLDIRFFTSQSEYQRRDDVTLIVDVRDANNKPVRASLSLSVTDSNFLPAPALEEPRKSTNLPIPKLLSYAAEERFTLTGNLTDPTTKQPINTEALSLYLPELKRFYRASSQQGKFNWDLPDFYVPTPVQVLNLDLKATSLTPKIDLQTNNIFKSQKPKSQLVRIASIKKYLHHLYQSRLIKEVFAQPNPSVQLVRQLKQSSEIPADKTYSTEGFINLRDIGDFIDEVILTARVNGSTEQQNRSVQLFNSDDKIRFSESPIYLINGEITTDEQAVLNLPLSEISSVQTYVATSTIDQYFDPLFITRGVLGVTTKNGIVPDFVTAAPNRIEVSGLHNQREFNLIKMEKPRSPLLQPTIFWDGKIITDEYGKANVTFPLTDTSGKIWVEIEGISVTGERGKLVRVLEVK